ncbi:FtsX-like permease family protein [Arabiibacter massiliensis]|uniref:FtsX-like permease family protein n=1 Tax=Arabiibacter massiliensis TaxID=1870985 RepID=UPI0009BA1BAE|nr:FtsX-like permease family protein [Arabiibacter massiliensis]
MMRLVLCDLRDHAATWVGAFCVAVACGFIGGFAASLVATAETYPNMESLAVTVIVFSALAAAAVLVSAANLTVAAQRRSYALWQLANVSPRRVSAVVLAQLAVVAVLGAAVGTLVEVASFAPLFPLVFSSPFYQPIDQVVLDVGLPLMPAVWLAVAGVFLVGGLKGARSAGKTPPMTALRAPELPRKGMTWLRAVLFAGLAFGTRQLASSLFGKDLDVLGNSLFLPLLMAAALVPVAPAVFSALLGAWTSLVPQGRWNAWYVARHTARHGLSVSTSVETPIMVGFGLVAGIFSLSSLMSAYMRQAGIVGRNASFDFTSTVLLLGGPVLLCAVGAAVSVVMTSRTRTRDVALLIASGARPETLVAAAACEALIHAVTATLAGMAVVVASNAVVAAAVGMPLFSGLAFGEGLAVSLAGFALVLAATLAPTVSALRKEPAAVLAVGE